MKVYAFIQMYNEESSGHLERCLNNCKRWSDKIIIYDDKSTDNSVELAKKYTEHIILGEKNEWVKETFHKETMLQYIHEMEEKPDWILWIDCDEIVDRNCIYNLNKFCKKNNDKDIDGFSFQQINLWRGERYYRTDGPLYGTDPRGAGWFVRLWKYTSDMTMKKIIGPDQRLYPITVKNIKYCDFKIIHYGFSNYKNLMKHIGVINSNKQDLIDTASGERYVKLANEGIEWAKNYVLNGKGIPNMFLNESKLTVEKTPDDWFPEENIPKIKYERPTAFPISELIPYNQIMFI
uniref:Glycosyl transferase family 2 n=1 Tax=Pithovirus LCPAC302 TaxID=2506593 RepID=A0A481Z6Y2_9VIRU|nr:MAG: glycosyl transferase family 2 [Pithovirus LCPAC302]